MPIAETPSTHDDKSRHVLGASCVSGKNCCYRSTGDVGRSGAPVWGQEGHDTASGPVCGWDPRACCHYSTVGQGLGVRAVASAGEGVSRHHARSTCCISLFW